MTNIPRMNTFTIEEISEILALDSKGMTMKEIAIYLGLPFSRVNKVVQTSLTRERFLALRGLIP